MAEMAARPQPLCPAATPQQQPLLPAATPQQQPLLPAAGPQQQPLRPAAGPQQPPLRPAASLYLLCPGSEGALRHGHSLSPSKGDLSPLRSRAALGSAVDRERVRCAAERPVVRDGRNHGRCVRRDTNTRRFGDNLPVGHTGNCHLSWSEADFGLSSMDCYDHAMSSSDKENVKPARKRLLDDALFKFFSREAVKSLKRNFTNFCSESDIWYQNKRLKDHSVGRDAFISYSIKYFWEVLKSMSNHRKQVIRNFGFGCLLLFEKSEIPSSFIRWLASCVDPVSSQIIVDHCKIMAISKDSVHFVTGLPNSGSVPMPNCEGSAKFIMSLLNLSELPHITFFGNKLKSKEVLSDKEIFVCFMVIAFKCLLFPTTDEFPNTAFLHILEEPDAAKGFDICLLVYDHFITGVHKFLKVCKRNGRKPKQFEFCYYFLAVYYLDSLDFGARFIDPSVPRISVWKGNLFKFFSDLDYKRNKIYGKRQLKKILPRCYREFGLLGDLKTVNNGSKVSSESPLFSLSFKQNMHTRFGKELDEKIIDGIIDSVRSMEVGNHDNVYKSELIVGNVLQLLLVSKSSEVKISTTNSNGLASPECLVTEIDGPYSSKTAPEMKPLRKVKTRLCNPMSEEHLLSPLNSYSAREKDPRHDCSPISRINFSQSLNDKIQTSPEVQITGSSKFSPRQAEMAKKGDNMYTSIAQPIQISPEVQISDSSNFSFRQAELPKKTLVLPLIQNRRFPVSPSDVKNYCAIVDLAYTRGVQKSYCVKFDKVHCSYISLGQSLMFEGHVDNFLIPVFCRKLFEDNHPTKFGRKIFWITTMMFSYQ